MCTVRQVVCATLLVGCLWGTVLGGPTIVSTTFRISGGDGIGGYLTDYGPIVSSTPIRDSVSGVAPFWDPEDMWTDICAASAAGYRMLRGGTWSLSEGMGVYAYALGTDLVGVGAHAAATYVFTCNTDRIYVDLVGQFYSYGVFEISYSLTGPGVSDSYVWWKSSGPWVTVTTIDETLSYNIIAGGEYTLSLVANLWYIVWWQEIDLCATVTCVPAPGAVLLGAIGAGLVRSMRRRAILV